MFKDINSLIKTIPDNTSINYYFKTVDENKSAVKVRCNDIYINFDSNPYIENGRTMVPIKGLMYILGGTSYWSDGIITIEKEDKKLY